MSTLLRDVPEVHSGPGPGPRLRAVGLALNYPHCNVALAADTFASEGTVGRCPVIEGEDVAVIDDACQADHDADAGRCPGEPRLPFADWVACQASWFRSQGTRAADWIAAEIDRLAEEARFYGADGPDVFTDRRDAYEAMAREIDRRPDDRYPW